MIMDAETKVHNRIISVSTEWERFRCQETLAINPRWLTRRRFLAYIDESNAGGAVHT